MAIEPNAIQVGWCCVKCHSRQLQTRVEQATLSFMLMPRVETLLLKLEQLRDQPHRLDFQDEIQHFTEEELRELGEYLARQCGLLPPQQTPSVGS